MENKEYEYAGFWIRAVASLIDGILFAIIIIPLLAMIYGDSWTGGGEVAIRGPAEFLIEYVFPFIAVVLFWYYRSATPGKMALNLAIPSSCINFQSKCVSVSNSRSKSTLASISGMHPG